MNADPYISEIGEQLVISAEQDDNFSAQRGLVYDLFPYIYRASKRMSTRAISRWLKESKNIKLSAATIAKALRESDRYWLEFFDEVEAAADIVARAHGWDSGLELLTTENAYFRETSQRPPVSGMEGIAVYEKARETVESLWFRLLDEAGREECLAVVEGDRQREEKEEPENESDSK